MLFHSVQLHRFAGAVGTFVFCYCIQTIAVGTVLPFQKKIWSRSERSFHLLPGKRHQPQSSTLPSENNEAWIIGSGCAHDSTCWPFPYSGKKMFLTTATAWSCVFVSVLCVYRLIQMWVLWGEKTCDFTHFIWDMVGRHLKSSPPDYSFLQNFNQIWTFFPHMSLHIASENCWAEKATKGRNKISFHDSAASRISQRRVYNSVILTAGEMFFCEDEDSSLRQKRYDGQSGSGSRCTLSSLDFALERKDHCYSIAAFCSFKLQHASPPPFFSPVEGSSTIKAVCYI